MILGIEKSEDQFGPEYEVQVRDPRLGMEGFLVIHNTALGVGKGGIRMTPDVSLEEVRRLASTMTWKNALAGIPFGGAKSGIRWSPAMAGRKRRANQQLKKKFIQSFARALKPFLGQWYIAGPDVNTGEKEMQWFTEASGDWGHATGKPAHYCELTATGKKCGIPHELGSTGFGVAQATKVALELLGERISGATVAIHGFGNVGTFTYKFLSEMGARVVAIANQEGALYRPEGLEPELLAPLLAGKKLISTYPKNLRIPPQDFFKLPVQILIPASVTDVINNKNKRDIRAKLIVEGANIPMQEAIEQELFQKNIMIVPDFVANAGGVISSYAEHEGYSPEKMFALVKRKIVQATRAVLSESIRSKKNPRIIAQALAVRRIKLAMGSKRRQTFLPPNGN